MKKVVTALALFAMMATPALAQTYDWGRPGTVRPYASGAYDNHLANNSYPRRWAATHPYAAARYATYAASQIGYGAYAAADAYGYNGYGPAVASYGTYAGWDPDPAIRLQLMRDPGSINAQ